MHRHAARFAALVLGAALLALAGCAETSPTTFYILSSLSYFYIIVYFPCFIFSYIYRYLCL